MEMAGKGKLHPEAGAGSAMTEIQLTDGYRRLDTDAIAFHATGRPLRAPGKNQLAQGKVDLMENAVCEMASLAGKAARVKHGTESTRSPLRACRRKNASSSSMGSSTKDFVVVDTIVTTNGYFNVLVWIAIIGAAGFCFLFLVRISYYWWHRPSPLNLQNRGLPNQTQHEHKTSVTKSAHRRLSSRSSPEG